MATTSVAGSKSAQEALKVEDGALKSFGGWALCTGRAAKSAILYIRVVFKTQGKTTTLDLCSYSARTAEPMMPLHYGYEVQIDSEPGALGRRRQILHGPLFIPKPILWCARLNLAVNGTPWRSLSTVIEPWFF